MVTEDKSVTPKSKLKKSKVLRHAEYYGMQDTFDKLYADSVESKPFDRLMGTILSRENILLAYRNIKGNKGSYTPGTDGLTIRDIGNYTPEAMASKVRNIIKNYCPRAVRRKDIPKPNGKTRPLGIPCIWDRLIQQCILQVLEPICEARFSDNSYGFRPNRSCEHAVAHAYKLAQQSQLHYVVEVDIKSFFDEVNHPKLVKQIWAMGIRDKSLIYIIRKILTAPIKMPDGTLVQPKKGTPQGGILSPLLANIALNELDRWIESQWQKNPVVDNYNVRYHKNGSVCSNAYRAMRGTNLKEMYIVRYADDFRIFCRTRKAADLTMIAVTKWLEERLKLQVSTEKTRVVNLKRQYSEFLGIKMKVRPKSGKQVVRSHVCDKAQKRIASAAKDKVKAIARPKDDKDEFLAITNYNSFVMGVHNYYRMATAVNLDFAKIAHQINNVLKIRLKERLSRATRVKGLDAVTRTYGKSKQIRYVSDHPIAPIGYVQTKNPMCKKRSVQTYTPEGRKEIHDNLSINTQLMLNLMRQPMYENSVQFADNQIARFCAQYGKCAVTGKAFDSADEIYCHRKLPKEFGGGDDYYNLVLVLKDVHALIHSSEQVTIGLYLKKLAFTDEQLTKVNELRSKAAQHPIPLA